ncbi:MAG: hypothetical protein VYA55_20485 [Pseudomonadota bacterium]|nr:hypothetical protein [Pseudomonadota bacterium]
MHNNKSLPATLIAAGMFSQVAVHSAQGADLSPTFAISAERTEQRFEFEVDDFDATIDSITLTPGLHWGDWHIALTLPWQAVDGEYFFNNLYPNLARACNQLNNLTPLQKWWLVQNTQLTQDSLDYCAETGGVETDSERDNTTGWNDVEVFANYFLPLDTLWLAGSIGFGYQHDNGDEYEGLGNGARQLFAETTWMASHHRLSLSATLGYFFVVEDNSSVGVDDHGYSALDARVMLGTHFELGIRYDYQQSDNDIFDDYDYLTYSIHFYAGRHWGGQIYLSDYDDEIGFPDEEYGLYVFYSL